MASNTALSMNIVMNSAIKGANFLQASTQGIYKYSSQVQKINLLRATKFGTLNRNVKTLDNHLTKLAVKANHIAKTPIKFDVDKSALMGARKELTAMAKDSQTIFNYSKQTNRVRNQKPLATTSQVVTTRRQKHSSLQATSATDVVAKGLIAGTMLMPFKPSIDFESEMARVKALSRATPLEFKGLVSEAKKLGATTEWKATEVSQGMSFLSMAGFKPKETQQAMSGVLSLATAGKTDLATTADISSNILSGFEMKATEMNQVADVMARTITTSNTTVQMLGDTMKYSAPASARLGADITEVATLAAKMGDVGIQGSMSGTAIRTMYTRLSAPPKEAQKALKNLGVSAFDESGKFKGMMNIIGDLNTALSSETDEGKSDYLKKIFGVEALSGAVAVMSVGKEKLLDYQETLKNSKGASKEIADIQLSTTAGEFKLLGSAMEGLSISTTSGLLPVISSITKGVTTLTSGIQFLSEQYPTLTATILGGTGVIIAGGIALTAFGFATTMMSKGVSSLGFLGKLTGRFKGLSIATSKAIAKQKLFNSLLSVDGITPIGKKGTFTKVAKGSKFTTTASKASKLSTVAKVATVTNVGTAVSDIALSRTEKRRVKNSKANISRLASQATDTNVMSMASNVKKDGTFTKVAKGSTFSTASKASSVTSFGSMGMKKNITLLTRFNGLIGKTTLLLRGIGLALVSNPIGLAVTAMVASGMLLYQNWQPIKAFFVGFGQGVSEALSPLAGSIKSVFSTVLSIFQPVANMAKKIFKWFGDITGASKWSKKELDGVASTGKKVGLIVGKAFSMAMTPVKLLLKAIQTVINKIGLVSKKIKSVMGNAKKAITDKAKSVKDSVTSFLGFGEKKEKIKTVAKVAIPANNVIKTKPNFKKVLDNKSKETFKSSTFVTEPGAKNKPSPSQFVTHRLEKKTNNVKLDSPLKKTEFYKPLSFNDVTEQHVNQSSSLLDPKNSVTTSKKTNVSIGNISVSINTPSKELDSDMVQSKVEKALREIKFDDADLSHEDVA